MKRIKNYELGIRVGLLVGALVFAGAACNRTRQPTVTIGSHVVNVEIAESPSALELGLSGRDSLAENNGMLFVLPLPGKYAFWMKDMKFPLDLIWIKDGKVWQITSNAAVQINVPENKMIRYTPAVDVDSVLEVNAGWSAKNNIKVGDSVVVNSK